MRKREYIMKVSVIHRAFEESSRLVAFVDVPDTMAVEEALEFAFEKTNNIAGSWSRGPEFEFRGEMVKNPDYCEAVTVMTDLPVSKRTGEVMGLRSTSMGDRMIVGNTCFKVDAFGFEVEEA
jgi:hypothetical protein